ncbi:MAG: hypothetical protein IJI37_02070 [Opitutales bacterium]|nr:hypothetical protein [Opitutales bacterium]
MKYLAYLIAGVAGFSSFAFAERYITSDQPASESFLKKYGRSFYVAENANAYPVPCVLDVGLEKISKPAPFMQDRHRAHITRRAVRAKIETAAQWSNVGRRKVLDFFDAQVYGKIPPRPKSLKFELLESSDDALGGAALRRQYKIISADAKGSHEFVVLVYIPKNAGGKVPAFVCPNFWGNYSISDEKQVIIPRPFRISGVKRVPVSDADRGCRPERIPVRDIVSRGFAIATFCYCDVYPDYCSKDGSPDSIYRIFDFASASDKGAAFAAWAWGDIRVMDLLERIPEIDARHVAVAGHSRLGKTALVAGAHDTRFAYVISNNSGCMGAALSKRSYGENIDSMVNANFPFWFVPEFKKYAGNERALPFDQHHFLAAVAPRMLYCASSSEDFWADPEGELLGLIGACPAFALFGAKNFPTLDALELEKPFHGDVAYHIKKAKHSMTPYDWKNYMDYAEKRGWKPLPPKK